MSQMHFTTRLPDTAYPEAAGPRLWPGAVMLGCSLVLVFLAGCFLIGVLGLVRPDLFIGGPPPATPVPLSAQEQALMFTLYGFAFASLLGAVVLFFLGVRWLCLGLARCQDTQP
jgi:hypothetical protein